MNIEIMIYGILLIIILFLLILIIVNLLNKGEFSTKFYTYKIKYDTNLNKYYSMLKYQKKVINKKKLQLLYLKFLLMLKGK